MLPVPDVKIHSENEDALSRTILYQPKRHFMIE